MTMLVRLSALVAALMLCSLPAHADTYQRAVLTQDGVGMYQLTASDGTVTIAAAQTGRDHHRELFWLPGQAQVTNRVCATWTVDSTFNSEPILQQGLAVRIQSAGGRTRALTVTRNVWAGAGWVFNAHTWDTSRSEVYQEFGQWDLGAVVTGNGGYWDLPWRACLQVVDATLTFKIWVPWREPEPSWSDPVHARTAQVPGEYLYSGLPGWYIGHIPTGGYASYAQLHTGLVTFGRTPRT